MARRAGLTAALFLFLTLPLHAVINGRVLDEDGKPLRGARVRVRALETYDRSTARMLSKDPQPQWLDTAETNDSGAFRVDTKSNAVVNLLIDAAGREFYERDFVDGEDAGTFVLRKSAARRGRVTANGKGVAGALVFVSSSMITRTDANGYYETPLPDSKTGINRVTVIHPDYAQAESTVRNRDRDDIVLDVALKPGTTIRGRVVDAAGRAVSGAVIQCYACTPARSGEDGSFEIAHAPSEKPVLYAREGNRAGLLLAGNAKPPFVIQLRPAATLTGTVRSNKDESPVPGARVALVLDYSDRMAMSSAITDAKGNFTIDGIEAGTRHLFAVHPAFFAGDVEQRFEEGARTSRIVYVSPYARIVGRVFDDDRKPVAAATVRMTFGGFSTTTAPDGTFSMRFPPMDRGPGMSVAVQKAPFAPGVFGPYSLAAGETKNVQLQLSRGTRFEIRLIDRDGAPVSNEPVLLSVRQDSNRFMRMPPLPCPNESTCRSDEQGHVVWYINEGAYDLLAGGDKTIRTELPNQTLNASSSPMTITLDRGVTVEGRVVWSDGSPANIPANVMTATPPEVLAMVTDGAFTLRVPAGKVTIVAEAIASSTARSQPVEVVAPAAGVTLKLPRPGRVEGRVVDRETNKAVTEFSVVLQPQNSHRWSQPKPFRASDGRFSLDDVTPGSYDLTVQASGFTRTNTTTVTVEETKTASTTIQLDRGARLAGRVTSEGRPLPDVEITAPAIGDYRSMPSPAKTDSNGEFTMDGLPPGSQRIEAHRSGYVPKTITVTLQPAQDAHADIELSRGREVRGRVVDAAGRPQPQTNIMVQGAPGSPWITTICDNDGVFKLTGLGDAPFNLTARKDGFVEQKVNVNPVTTSDLTITLDRGGTITGRVIGLSPSELPFVEVRVSYTNAAQPDAQGAFTITGVSDGQQVVMAMLNRPRRREIQTRVTVAGGTASPVELDFNAGIAVRGKVTQRGQVVEGSIRFMLAGQPLGRQIAGGGIGRDGTYEVRVAAPGEYTVQVGRGGSSPIEAGRVNVLGDMTYDIELRGATLSGIVVDAVTRQPIVNASVLMVPGMEVRTNGAGKFTFDLIVDGKYRLLTSAWSHAPDVRMIEVANGVAPEVEIAMAAGVEARFRIIDGQTGQLAEAPFVSVMDATSNAMVFGGAAPPADANGVRSLLLQPGTYRLTCGGAGYSVSKPVMLTVPGPLLEVTVEPQKR
jgi:carboxypeptidase family protein